MSMQLQQIRVITKLPNSEQSYKGKVKTHKYINRHICKVIVIQVITFQNPCNGNLIEGFGQVIVI
jgi:hypothetical protein